MGIASLGQLFRKSIANAQQGALEKSGSSAEFSRSSGDPGSDEGPLTI